MVLFGSMFKSGVIPDLIPYGGDFISYILIGSIGWGFMWSIMSGTAGSLRMEMEIGTLESILLTRTSIYTMVIAYTVFSAIFGIVSIIVLVVFGFVLFGISVFATASIFTLIFLLLSMIMMTGIGMILGGLTVWIKNIGDTIPLIQSITQFFCPVFFPIAVLPEFLQTIAKYLPFYYSIEGLRLSLIPGIPASELIRYALILAGLSIIFVIIGAYALHKGLVKAKKDGSLSFY
jgi:ABC-2 type transport system permease protein